MVKSLDWKPEFFEVVIVLATVIICLVGHRFTIRSTLFNKLFIKKCGEEKATIRWFFFRRYAGFFYFLLIPVAIIYTLLSQDITRYGVGIFNLPESLIWIFVLGILIVLFQWRYARNPVNLKQYPQLRVPVWTVSLVVKNSFGWLLYLISYEFMFRGFLLFGTINALGLWPAILVNTVIYSVAHISKGIRETILSIPFGILLCYLTVKTGTIWVAVFLHFILAVSNDIFSIIAHPDMKLER